MSKSLKELEKIIFGEERPRRGMAESRKGSKRSVGICK